MSVPPQVNAIDEPTEWAELASEAKRERLLRAAAAVFGEHGLAAPMPAVAAAAGAGVGSVYRQFPSKEELLAALVVGRLDEIAEQTRTATAAAGDRWAALVETLRAIVRRQASDDCMPEAHLRVREHPDVVAATQRTMLALEELLAAARAEGRLRSDVTTLDLRMLFAATRAASQIDPSGWQRMLALLVDSFDTRRGTRPDPRVPDLALDNN